MNAAFTRGVFANPTGRVVPSWQARPFYFLLPLLVFLGCASQITPTPWPTVVVRPSGQPVPAAKQASQARTFVPKAAGVLAYEAQDPAREVRGPASRDGLVRGFHAILERAAKAAGVPPPLSGPRYEAAAAELAAAVDSEDGVADDLTRFIHSHCGIVEPEHTMLVVRASPHLQTEQLAGFEADLTTLLRGTPWRRVGVAVDRRPDGDVLVAAFFRQYVVLSALPRRLRGRTRLSGRLLDRHSELQAIVVTPSGATRGLRVNELRSAAGADGFETFVACDAGAGRYQIELLGTAGLGPTVLANFPVYCDIDPPATLLWKAAAHENFPDAFAAERAMVVAVNQDRGRAGVRPVIWNEALARVARAHSDDMAESGVVAHVSARTGSTLTRAQKAGLSPSLLAENVGQAGSVADIQRGLMGSPGHRSNILDPRITQIGIGITPRRLGAGQTVTLFVTQLFAAGID